MSGGGSGGSGSGSGTSSVLSVDEDSSIIFNTTASQIGTDSDSDMNSAGLAFSSVSIIIPVVVFSLLVFTFIGYYIWRCYTQYQELIEAEKEENAKNVKVPIAEPEDFPPVVPLTVTTSPSDDDIVLADRDLQNNIDNVQQIRPRPAECDIP